VGRGYESFMTRIPIVREWNFPSARGSKNLRVEIDEYSSYIFGRSISRGSFIWMEERLNSHP